MLNFDFWVPFKLNLQTLINWWQARAATIRHLLISVTRSVRLLLHTALIWSYQFYFKWMKQSQCLFVKCLQSCKMSWWDVMAPAGTVISEISATLSWLSSHGYWSSPTLQQLTMSHSLSSSPSLAKCQISGFSLASLFSPCPPCSSVSVSSNIYKYPSMSLPRIRASQTPAWAHSWVNIKCTQLRSVAD